ncbi:MAG: SLBB domain-containing protein [Pyrinomonadaceae bacterium]
MKKIFTLFAMVIIFGVIGTLAQMPQTDAPLRPYLIGPRDKVEAKVMGEEQFGFETFVDELGNIYVPFDDVPIHAKCKTVQEVREEVTQKVAKYVRNPAVSFNVVERTKPVPVTVFGMVRTPSTVELYREATLMEVLATVGGPNDDAGGTVRVFRPQVPACFAKDSDANWKNTEENKADVPSKIYSLNAIQSGTRDSNPVIYPGDIVFVDKADPVYINGEVRQPQGIYIKEGGLSLAQAIAMVGGVNETADLKKVFVYRRKLDSQDREVIQIDLKETKELGKQAFMLKPYDEVLVGKKKKNIGELVLDTVLKTGVGAATSFGYQIPNRILY